MLNSKQIAFLKAKSHSINPVVYIGFKGVTESVINEININLNAHELIKIKIKSDSKDERSAALNLICEEVQAQPVNHVGKLLVIFRAKKETSILLP
jgi:RNA-binding protein